MNEMKGCQKLINFAKSLERCFARNKISFATLDGIKCLFKAKAKTTMMKMMTKMSTMTTTTTTTITSLLMLVIMLDLPEINWNRDVE